MVFAFIMMYCVQTVTSGHVWSEKHSNTTSNTGGGVRKTDETETQEIKRPGKGIRG